MATLWVGANETYKTLQAAVNAAANGDTINVRAGVYENQFATIGKSVTIVGIDGKAHFKATVAPPNGKAIFVTNGNITLENIEFSGAKVSSGNGAGIRYEGGNLTVKNSYFHHNENGILAASDPAGTIRISGSEFGFNGKGDGYTHNVYVNKVASLSVENSHFHDANIGHHVKSRAAETTVLNSKFVDGTMKGVYAVDVPNGGKTLIKGNYIEQGAIHANKIMVAYGAEGSLHAASSFTVEGNTFVNKAIDAIGVKNFTASVTAQVLKNGFQNVPKWIEGAATSTGNVSGPAPTTNTAPDAVNDTAIAKTSTELKINVLANDKDADGDAISVTGVTQGANGAVKINADGTVSYTSKAGFVGTDSFTYSVKDAKGAADTATVSVKVDGTTTTTTTTTAGTVKVRVSGDEYNGDPQFNFVVDGRQVGTTKSVTADHINKQWQEFTFTVDNLSAAKKVGVQFINDAYGGRGFDRNLWVDAIEVNGKVLQAETAGTYKTTTGKILTGTEFMGGNGVMEFDMGLVGVGSGSATMG